MKIFIFTVIIIFCFASAAVAPVAAQECYTIGCPTGQQCVGGYCVETPPGLKPEFTGAGALGKIASRTFKFVLPIMGIVGFIFILWAGIQFLTSKGDPKALQAAQAKLTYAIIGLIFIALSYSITKLVFFLFGLKGV